MNNRWIGAAAAALIAYGIVSSWPEIERYRRMLSM